MAQTFLHTLFGPGARAMQAAAGSRASYARMEAGAGPVDVLTERELDFIAARDRGSRHTAVVQVVNTLRCAV